MTTNNKAVRVADGAVDESLIRAINLPAHLSIHIPALNEVRVYDLTNVSDEQLIDMLEHGASQKLTDAAAGKKGEKATEAVDKREDSLWALTGTRGSLLDPVTRVMYELTLLRMAEKKIPTKKHPKVRDFSAWLELRSAEFVANLRAKAETKLAADREILAGLAEDEAGEDEFTA